MGIALLTGQRYLDLLRWHPRDVDTLLAIYEEQAERQAEQAREERFAAMTAELKQRMGR